ncbi:MAG TPA: flippase [Terriglobales bacterium]
MPVGEAENQTDVTELASPSRPASPPPSRGPSRADHPDFHLHFATISKQSAVFFAGTIFTAAAGYFFKIYLARVMGAEALGIYTIGMTIVGLAGVVGALGLPQTAARFVAVYSATGETRKLARFLWYSTVLLCFTNVLVGSVLLIAKRGLAVGLYHTPALVPLMRYFVIIMFLGALTTFGGQCLAGYKDVAKRTVLTNFIGTPVTIILSVLLIAAGFGLRGYLAAQVSAAALLLLLLAVTVWTHTPQPARFVPNGFPVLERAVVSFSAVLFVTQCLEFLATQTDRVLLGVYLSARELGIYSIAAALAAFVAIVLQSINQVFAPTIAELYAKAESDLLLRLYQLLTKWTLALTMPLALVMMVFAKPLMAIFGQEFAVGWPVLVVATLGQLVNCGVGSVGQLLLMSGKQRRTVRAQLFVVPLTIALNVVLIPRIGLLGAAIAAATANALLNVLLLQDVRTILSLRPSGRSYLSLMLPTALTLGIVCFIRVAMHGNSVSIFLALLLAYSVFMATMVAARLEEDEKTLVTSAWKQLIRIAGL